MAWDVCMNEHGGCGCHFTHPDTYTHPAPGQDYRCMRCGHEWRSRRAVVAGVAPVHCSRCKSAYWMRAAVRAPGPVFREMTEQHVADLTGRVQEEAELAKRLEPPLGVPPPPSMRQRTPPAPVAIHIEVATSGPVPASPDPDPS